MIDDKDKDILKKLQDGLTYKEIAVCLFMSIHTVKHRVRVMKDKFDCTTISNLIYKTITLKYNNIEEN
jgi:DNA-binding CsgD family transcriptional regulator